MGDLSIPLSPLSAKERKVHQKKKKKNQKLNKIISNLNIDSKALNKC